MRKRILCVGLIALAVLMMTACQPRYIFWPIPDMDKSTPYDVESPEEFTAMLATAGQVRLTNDIELTALNFGNNAGSAEAPRSIDLNGNTLTIPTASSFNLGNGANVVISNGALELGVGDDAEANICNMYVKAGATLTLKDVELHTGTTGIYVDGMDATANIVDSTIIADSGYGVSTNASSSKQNVNINIINSTVIGRDVGALINVPGTLTITDSVVQGGHVAVIVRGGTANITDSTIHSIGDLKLASGNSLYYFTASWGSGNHVAYAALTLGNASENSYKYPTTVTLKNTEVVMDVNKDINPDAKRIFIASANGEKAILISDNSTYIDEIKSLGEYKAWRGTDSYVQVEGEEEIHLVSEP